MVTLAEILQTLRFPGSAAFHRRVEDFRLQVAVYTLLHSYTYASLLCACLWPRLDGGTVIVALLHIPCSYSYILTLYRAMYNGYDTYGAFRRS